MEELVKPKLYDYYIYRVTLITDGRTYIGKRYISLWYTPAAGMDKYTPGEYYGSGDHIKNAVKCYGVENFSRDIIDEYHDITNADIKAIEKEYIIAEWAAGHGEFNHAAESYGGNIWDGMPEDRIKESKLRLSSAIRAALSTMTPEEISERARRSVKYLWENMTPEERSERQRKSVLKQIENGTHNFTNMTHEERSEMARKNARTLWDKGANSLQNLTHKQRSDRSKKVWSNMALEKIQLRSENRALSMSIEWVFYNPTTMIYKVHVANWKSRFKYGYSERLCKLSDWDDYKFTHNLDVELNY